VKSRTTADFSRFSTKDPDSMSIDDTPASAPVLPGIYETPESAVVETQESTPRGLGDTCKSTDVDVKDRNSRPQNEPPVSTSIVLEEHMEPAYKPPASSAWLGGWFGRPVNLPPPASQNDGAKPDEPPKPDGLDTSEDKPDTTHTTDITDTTAPVISAQTVEATAPHPLSQPEEGPATAPGGSWFGFWSSGIAAPVPAKIDPAPVSALQSLEEPSQLIKPSEDVVMEDAPLLDNTPAPPPKAGSTWAFWSRDPGPSSSTKNASPEEAGQLAVIGESSEAHPKRANSMELKASSVKEPSLKSAKDDQEASTKKNKRTRPLSMGTDEITGSRPVTPKRDMPVKAELAPKAGNSKTPVAAKSAPNLLLPSFSNTYRQKDNPSIIQQIAQLLLRTRQTPTKHVFLTKEQPRIKKALAIGVHGLYPANYLRSVIGQPTGTSIKFANHSAEAIRRWTDSHDCEDCEIEKVALEGEGKIGDRVENLWILLLNWIDHIRKADLIIFGCHSQGVPVSIMLLAKLIELGIITTAKVGICAMGESKNAYPGVYGTLIFSQLACHSDLSQITGQAWEC